MQLSYAALPGPPDSAGAWRLLISLLARPRLQGFGWAIAKCLAEAGAEISLGVWVPALNIFGGLTGQTWAEHARSRASRCWKSCAWPCLSGLGAHTCHRRDSGGTPLGVSSFVPARAEWSKLAYQKFFPACTARSLTSSACLPSRPPLVTHGGPPTPPTHHPTEAHPTPAPPHPTPQRPRSAAASLTSRAACPTAS